MNNKNTEIDITNVQEDRHIVLASEIQSLKKELEDSEWASKKTNEGIKILYKELEKKNNEIRHLDQLKTHFMDTVSHEFKNPLFIIRESLTIMLDDTTGQINEEQKTMLNMSISTVNRLMRLVYDLLDISKIESGKMEMKRSQIDMPALLEENIKTYEKQFTKKNISLTKNIAKLEPIWIDKDKISQAVINLISNAIKYTPEKGSANITLEDAGENIKFEIQNSGPGIPPESINKIFDKFERVTAEKQEGTGLGLPITKEIIELHRGKIWVESKPEQWTKFSFTLPKDLRAGR
ncbi:integral membrane sensor signal transduction histidine kinase [Candidatus Omnitrophus magneticus]|uniref:histidine kinase n=1 Tax=Candidatus Omnitrophus magneticus TaxID=1609969 RepID=A0A0F0CPV0_9BACT|nr:integral membrane sensor signal transduction histidine kinase [Candidatus Omnitrophus magneticus]